MAVGAHVNAFSALKYPYDLPILSRPLTLNLYPPSINFSCELIKIRAKSNKKSIKLRRSKQTTVRAAIMLPENAVMSDICATLISGAVAGATLALWEVTAKYGVFDSVNFYSLILSRKS